ncbi:MAG: bifunctional 5,10-methylenetetrahydrofolate dehydrogenase/5,10-methenyltetrahydrofolate cyclohydrolase [Nitrososphaera sp.]|uniref:Bifunctional protein FolD n=1 Tax=Nitrososphaera gargensis (strain Ga9.2) TaxID=1237085 RepID=K0IH46_NITGG|nr:bifunctional 5,10-methylenetetrahydrofolate dehydrogenase/5,10-methenyltetrahydrofolate cyclohydrolase [Candidatus Nitrososphaera gargensis]AFU59190.1 bifunctional protein FolD [Candidatus Nitrososphaera gargensis Ga9.2]
MVARIIDGKVVSADVKARVKKAVEQLKDNGVQPCLATVLVGDDPASATYVGSKQSDAKEVGIATRDHRLTSTFKQSELVELMQLLNNDHEVHGILVQLPLPKHIDEFEVIAALSPFKDVDGLTPYNAGMLQSGMGVLKPCTPSGIIELLDYYKIDITGMDAVVVNRSNLVGKPLALLLLERNATVTICHSKTKDLNAKLHNADLVVTAVGNRQRFTLTGDMIKEGAIVIDVGIARLNNKLVGDADFESVKQKASWVTPVPGGVGLMTRAMLLKNTVTAASISKEMSR